jgi:hypothetical protein
MDYDQTDQDIEEITDEVDRAIASLSVEDALGFLETLGYEITARFNALKESTS